MRRDPAVSTSAAYAECDLFLKSVVGGEIR